MFLWDIMKTWVCDHTFQINNFQAKINHMSVDNSKRPKKDTGEDAAKRIMRVEVTRYGPACSWSFNSMIDMTIHPNATPDSVSQGLVRFHAPPPNWGPLPKAHSLN